MINTTQRDNDLLATVMTDLNQLEIVNVQQDNVIKQMLSGAKMINVEGRQPFMEAGETKNIEYSVILRNSDYMRFYHPISLFVRVSEEPRRSRTFDLTKGEYFTLSQAVNLLHDRPVARPELVRRKIVDRWYSLDERKRDDHGNRILNATSINGVDLSKSLGRFPIKPSTIENKEMIRMLKNGDLVSATLLKDGLEQQTYIRVSQKLNTVVENSRGGMQSKLHRGHKGFARAF